MAASKWALLLLLTTIIIPSVFALTASISNPRMVLYHNITEDDTLEFDKSVIINNNNNYEVKISITLAGDWEGKITLSEKEFIMGSGERKEVPYSVKINNPGYYRGDVLVRFDDPISGNFVSLAQDLVVLVADESGKVPQETSESFNWLGKGMGAGIVLLLVLIVLIARRKK
jgi:hypothetical protein